jgi:RHS repeat-associated protein
MNILRKGNPQMSTKSANLKSGSVQVLVIVGATALLLCLGLLVFGLFLFRPLPARTEFQRITGDVDWLLADHQATIRDVVRWDDANSETDYIEQYQYDTFGNLVLIADITGTVISTDRSTAVTRYQYTGRDWDADAGLQYNRMRWYDPATGRWINEDPIGFAGGDANLARYVGNDSTNEMDPSGQSPISKAALIAAKKAAKELLQKIIKETVEKRIKRIAGQQGLKAKLKQFAQEAADILDEFDRATSFDHTSIWSWCAEGVELLPVVGDAVGITRFSKAIWDARKKLDKLDDKMDAAEKAAKSAARQADNAADAAKKAPKGKSGGFEKMKGGNNKFHNKQFKRIADDLGLSKSQRRQLHDEIHKHGGEQLDLDDIRSLAEDLFGGSR